MILSFIFIQCKNINCNFNLALHTLENYSKILKNKNLGIFLICQIKIYFILFWFTFFTTENIGQQNFLRKIKGILAV